MRLTVEQKPLETALIALKKVVPVKTTMPVLRHINHALGFLKVGGTLVSVMSAGVGFRDNRLTRDFRDMVSDSGGEFFDLPEDSFKESGTQVSTVIVRIFKN